MKITVFAKSRQTESGKKFYVYVSRLRKNDGTEFPVKVNFKDDNVPKEFPIIINVDKKDANLSTKTYVDEATGDVKETKTLWVTSWTSTDEVFVDHSLDDIID